MKEKDKLAESIRQVNRIIKKRFPGFEIKEAIERLLPKRIMCLYFEYVELFTSSSPQAILECLHRDSESMPVGKTLAECVKSHEALWNGVAYKPGWLDIK